MGLGCWLLGFQIGLAAGMSVGVPRIVLNGTNPRWLFVLQRKQFPARVYYGMTIYKSQCNLWRRFATPFSHMVSSTSMFHVSHFLLVWRFWWKRMMDLVARRERILSTGKFFTAFGGDCVCNVGRVVPNNVHECGLCVDPYPVMLFLSSEACFMRLLACCLPVSFCHGVC